MDDLTMWTTLLLVVFFVKASVAECPQSIQQGPQCSLDCSQLGYCDTAQQWYALLTCPVGTLCINGACVAHTTCPSVVPAQAVRCADPAAAFPDLVDATCAAYYTCQTDGVGLGYGLRHTCSPDEAFDSCLGTCVAGGTCSQRNDPCTIDRPAQALLGNPQLAVACDPAYTLWLTCPGGAFTTVNGQVACVSGNSQGCPNGSGTDAGQTCSVPGKYPIPGNTCEYIHCYSNGSYSQFKCSTGYYFNSTSKKCERGTCTGQS